MNDDSVATSAASVAQVFFAAYRAHDIDMMLDLCTDSAELRHVPMGRLETGNIRTVGRKAWSDIFTALPDLTVTVESVVAGRYHVAAEVVIADQARGFALPQAYFLAFNSSYKITQVTVYWDNVTLGFEATKAGALRIVEALTSLRKHR